MDGEPEYLKLSAAAGISPSYAHEILSGTRTPSRPLAITIYRKTGLRTAPIAKLSDAEIALLEKIERDANPPAQQDAAA